MFCEESLGKINAKYVKLFQNGLVHKLCHLKVLITLEQVNGSEVEKKENPNKQNFDGEAHLSGVVNFHCMQRSLVMSIQIIFGDDWNDVPRSSRSLAMM